jgi:membrane associated rhomboid family serine protease
MTANLLAQEPVVRLVAFAGVFGLMTVWVVFAPKRRQAIGRLRRWPANFALVAVDTLAIRLIFLAAAVGAALVAEAAGATLKSTSTATPRPTTA